MYPTINPRVAESIIDFECLLQFIEMFSELYFSGNVAIADNQVLRRRPKVLHIAVLECEQMPESIVQSHGNFTNIFDRWLQLGVKRVNAKRPARNRIAVRVSGWRVLDDEYPSDTGSVDAFIITGSTCSAYDNFPWIATLSRYIKDVYESRPLIKFFGSCFGHQLLAQTLLGKHGVTVEKSEYGWENGVHDIMHSVQFVSHFPFLTESAMRYQFVHRDHVIAKSLPYGWLSIGYSDMCAIQGLFQPGRVLTYQGHPEFDRQILYYFMDMLDSSGALNEEEYALSLKLIDQDSTSSLAAEVVLEFLDN